MPTGAPGTYLPGGSGYAPNAFEGTDISMRNFPGGQRWADKNYKGGFEQYYKDTHGGTSYKERDHTHRLDRSFDQFNRDNWNEYQMNQESLLGSMKQYDSPEYLADVRERAEGYADSADKTMRGATMRTLDRADAGGNPEQRSATQQKLGLASTLARVDVYNRSRQGALELRDAARDSLAGYREGILNTAGQSLQSLMSARSARRGENAAAQAGMYGGVAQGIGMGLGALDDMRNG